MFLPSHLYTGSGSDQKSTGSGSATLGTGTIYYFANSDLDPI